jgi:hypothetical protein
VEPSAISGGVRPRPRPHHQAGPPGLDLTDLTATANRSALAAAALAACVVGLLGVDGGLLWAVAGVFTVRALAGAPPGIAWGIACLGAGLRWGTFGLGELEVATRLFGPTVTSGAPVVRGAMVVALLAALVDEARDGGLVAGSWVERAASLMAIVILGPLYVVAGPADAWTASAWWAVAAGGGVLASLGLRPWARSLPAWAGPALAASGVVVAAVAA